VQPMSSVTLNKTYFEIKGGEKEKLTATISPSNTTDYLVWTSSNTRVAVVDDNGNVTAIGEGEATITATSYYGSANATCSVKVFPSEEDTIHVTGVKLSSENIYVPIGKTHILKANVLPSDATYKDVKWSSSNEGIAKVENGTITAVSEGKATITVETVSGGYKAYCTVNVTPDREISSFTAKKMGSYLMITLTANNTPENAIAFIRALDGDGLLLDIEPVTIVDGLAETILPAANIKKLKAFIWYNEGMKPVSKSVEISVQ